MTARARASDALESFSLDDQETTGVAPPPQDLTRSEIGPRIDSAESELRRIVRDYLDDSPELHTLAKQIIRDGKEGFVALTDGDEERLRSDDDLLSALEVVVRADGSRPSFFVRNGKPDLKTSPLGDWGLTIAERHDEIKAAIAAVGRIDLPGIPGGFVGTGFQLAKNLIATNRHVLQAIGASDSSGQWQLKPGAGIDFGHEYRAVNSIAPRLFRSVVFAGPKVAGEPIDHNVLDLVLIELDDGEDYEHFLSLDISPDWADQTSTQTFTIGYPAQPPPGQYSLSLLEQLFQSTYGYKRLAPGQTLELDASLASWTMRHDTTTLGGNSGSVIVTVNRPGSAAGIHYGGTRRDPRANWGHIWGRTLEEKDAATQQTLRSCLTGREVVLIDRALS